jgi:hypothetical protein
MTSPHASGVALSCRACYEALGHIPKIENLMAFVFNDNPVAQDFEETDYGSWASVVVYSGVDRENFKTYFVDVSLRDCLDGTWEYYFAILERDTISNHTACHYSSTSLSGIFSEDDRSALMTNACIATARLLTIRKPDRIKRVTYDENLPAKALDKHHMISGVMASVGYRIKKASQWKDRTLFIAER